MTILGRSLPHPQVKQGDMNTVGSVSIDPAWKSLLEDACVLKEALDHVLRWRDQGPNKQWVNTALEQHGLCVESFRWGSAGLGPQNPLTFGKMLLGSWISPMSETKCMGIVRMPPWAVIGWVRKDQYQMTPQMSRAKLQETVACVCDEKPSSYGFEGIPLYWAGEGKNRTQLFRLADAPRLSVLTLYARPSFAKFKIRPVVGLPWAIAFEMLRLGGNSSIRRAFTKNPRGNWRTMAGFSVHQGSTCLADLCSDSRRRASILDSGGTMGD